MTAIDFPNSPTLNQEFTSGSRTWIWNGTVWAAKVIDTSVSRYDVSDTAPSSPIAGDVWFNSTNARTYVYYDGTWVESNPSLAGVNGADGADGANGADGADGESGVLTPVTVSSNITLATKNRYFVDTTAARTLTLPAAPAVGDEIQVFDATGTAGTNNITVSNNSLKINGVTDSALLDVNGVAAVFIYTGSTYGWRLG